MSGVDSRLRGNDGCATGSLRGIDGCSKVSESGYPGSGEALVPSTLNSYTPSGLLPRDWGTDYNTTVGPGVRGPSG